MVKTKFIMILIVITVTVFTSILLTGCKSNAYFNDPNVEESKESAVITLNETSISEDNNNNNNNKPGDKLMRKEIEIIKPSPTKKT